jgi:ribonuclease HI
MPYYAVARGRSTGIFETWGECLTSIDKFSGAVYKKFTTHDAAQVFLNTHAAPSSSAPAASSPPPAYYVYTDGACAHNGRSNAIAGIGVYFGPDDPRNVSQRVEGKQSNNTAELTALLTACMLIVPDARAGIRVGIMSDSVYAIRCATSYGQAQAAAGWTKDIPNKDLVRQVYEVYQSIAPNVTLTHVMAHTGKSDAHSVGNDGADRLANAAIGLTACPYA